MLPGTWGILLYWAYFWMASSDLWTDIQYSVESELLKYSEMGICKILLADQIRVLTVQKNKVLFFSDFS